MDAVGELILFIFNPLFNLNEDLICGHAWFCTHLIYDLPGSHSSKGDVIVLKKDIIKLDRRFF